MALEGLMGTPFLANALHTVQLDRVRVDDLHVLTPMLAPCTRQNHSSWF